MRRRHLVVIFSLFLVIFSFFAYAEAYENENKFETLEIYNKAQDLYKEGKYDQAVEEYLEFLKLYPDNTLGVAAMYYTAESYQKQGKNDKAAEYYKKLIDKYRKGFWVDSAKENLKTISLRK